MPAGVAVYPYSFLSTLLPPGNHFYVDSYCGFMNGLHKVLLGLEV